MKHYIMALDQGTTSSRCILFDKKGQEISIAAKEFHQYYPHPGWVEHNPEEIWETQYQVALLAMEKAGIAPEQIAGIGITNQRETTIVWEKETGKPIYPAIVWQCRRTAESVEKFAKTSLGKRVQKITGLIPDAYFSASKVKWILDHVQGSRERAARGELLFGTVDTWLIWKLSGGKIHATDVTNASRTMLFDINCLQWDEELLEEFAIPLAMMPKVEMSSHIFGMTEEELFGTQIPIAGVAGDQQAALFGQCCFAPGEGKNTYGTGCFLLMNTGEKPVQSQNGLLTTVAIGLKGKVEYALEGSVFVGGASIQWLRDELRVISTAAESEKLALAVKDTVGAYVVPAFTGLGAPHWDPYARGTIVGMTRGFSREHLVRATLESIAYQAADVVRSMEQDAKIPISHLRVDGGACANGFLMQFQSDILHIPVIRPSCIETTALGAAYLAGLAVGYWKNREEILTNQTTDSIFTPEMKEETRRKKISGWKRAVQLSKGWAREEQE